MLISKVRGGAVVARQAHNLEVDRSNRSPATLIMREFPAGKAGVSSLTELSKYLPDSQIKGGPETLKNKAEKSADIFTYQEIDSEYRKEKNIVRRFGKYEDKGLLYSR